MKLPIENSVASINATFLALLVAIMVFTPGSQAATQIVEWGNTNWAGHVPIPSDLTNVIAVAGRHFYNWGLNADSTVVSLDPGVLGWDAPPGLSNVVAFSTGDPQMVVKADGTVVAWDYTSGGLRKLPSSLTNIVALSAGVVENLALRADGKVVAWQDGFIDELDASSIYGPPAGLSDVVAVAAGWYHSLALKSDGTVVAWGENHWGELDIPANLSHVVAIATGNTFNLALKADGTIAWWGTPHVFDFNIEFVTPENLTNVIAIACAFDYNLALKVDGTVTAWGANEDFVNYSLGVTNVPPTLSNAIAIATGTDHNFALVSDSKPVQQATMTDPRWNRAGFSVSLPTPSGKVYRLEYKGALTETNWTALPLVAGNGVVLTLTDATATASQRFYRVRRW